MKAERRYRLFQIKPGKAMAVTIDPADPKGLKAIQKSLRELDKKCIRKRWVGNALKSMVLEVEGGENDNRRSP